MTAHDGQYAYIPLQLVTSLVVKTLKQETHSLHTVARYVLKVQWPDIQAQHHQICKCFKKRRAGRATSCKWQIAVQFFWLIVSQDGLALLYDQSTHQKYTTFIFDEDRDNSAGQTHGTQIHTRLEATFLKLLWTRSKAVARTANRTAKNCHMT